MPTGKQQSTWAQAAGKGLNNNNNNSNTAVSCPSVFENESSSLGGSASKVMKMADHANESQIAAAFSEGWGQRQGVNQDTAWDVPSSPQCSPKEGNSWSATTSTGTEIWENNVRHHSKVPNVNNSGEMREPWGHAPTTHIGGTWGEEEDTTDMWTGVPQASSAPWSGEANTSVWGANAPAVVAEGKNWGNQNSAPVNFSTWGGDSAPMQMGLAHMPLSNEAKTIDENVSDGGAGVWADPAHKRAFGNWSPITGANKKPVQPSGWEETAALPVTCQSASNFDDGTAVWGNPVHRGKVSHWKDMPPNKQMPNCILPPGNMCATGNSCTGPGMIRLPPAASNVNKNDSWMKTQTLNRGLNWSDMPPNHRDTSGRRIWDDLHNQLQDKNVPGTPNTPNSAFGSWADPNHQSGNYWPAKSKNSMAGWADGQVDTSSWGGPLKQGSKPLSKDLIWASKQFRLLTEMNFKKDDVENALRRCSMNYDEALLELHAMSNKEGGMMEIDGMGGLNLNQNRLPHSGIGDDLNFSEQSLDGALGGGNIYGSNNYPALAMFSSGYNLAQNCKNQAAVGNNVTPNVLGNSAANNPAPNFNLNNGLNNMSPAMMRKVFQQNQAFNPNSVNNQTGRMNQQNVHMPAQLRLLVQQIQMAVQAGHLNPQILQHPLAPQTLQLMFQLLQQIRLLHQLQQQQILYNQHGVKPNCPPMQLSVSITQTKQHVVNLQNQIAAHQAIFLKQQQNVQLPVQHPSLQTPQPSAFDVVKSNLDAINGLHMDFRDLSVKESSSQSHSRLNQWKMSAFEKDDIIVNDVGSLNRDANAPVTEFSRAPGSVSKSSSANSLSSSTAPHSSSVLQPLNENTWGELPHAQKDAWATDGNDPTGSVPVNVESGMSVVRDLGPITCDGASNKLTSASDKESSATTIPSTSSSSQSSYNFNDLVPEFEPGKPWKGSSRIKNFEDDPHVTPGSIAKSPLSLNSIKDSDLFTWNTKSNVPGSSSSSASSLTTSTWSFSPPPVAPSTIQNSTAMGKQNASKAWGPRSNDASGCWKGPSLPKTRGPPPGLAAQSKNMSANWMNEGTPQNWSNSGWDKQNGYSNFLVLRNLTPQIDGSTLKTLCLQHGPLQLFHLLLNHGIALVRYFTREESEKARCALNNCVFSNTTILVDIPTEAEVKQYLQLAGGGQSMSWSQGGNGDIMFGANTTYPLNSSTPGSNTSSSSAKINSTNWKNTSNLNLPGSNTLWSFTGTGNGLWGMQSSANDQDQGIAGSLNSFLPPDLLGGGESI